MCSHYQSLKKADYLRRRFPHIKLPDEEWKWDMWPRYPGLFIRRPPELESGDEAVPPLEAVVGRWGLVSGMTRSDGLAKALKLSTFNARSETAARSYTFSNAWKKGQRCLIPAECFFEPDWRSGKAVAARFTRSDGEPMMIAGLWDRWRDAAGQIQESYTILTINADQHPLLRDYHRPGDEKRMVVILPEGAYEAWLDIDPEESTAVLIHYPADRLVAIPTVDEG